MKLSRILFFIALLAAVFWLYGINYWQIMDHQNIKLSGKDGKKIAADLYPANNPKGWVLFAHSMPETKESWKDLANRLKDLGYESLAIDLCGHGESDGGPNSYQKFSDAEHQAGIKDLEAAWGFLKSRGALPEKTVVVGASIGANLSLQFLTENPDFNGGILLSPGNYKGIDSAILVKRLNENQKILFVASRKDERSAGNNAEDNQNYYNLAAQVKNRHLIVFDGAGHGESLLKLEEEYDLTGAIIKFLEIGKTN